LFLGKYGVTIKISENLRGLLKKFEEKMALHKCVAAKGGAQIENIAFAHVSAAHNKCG